MANLDKNTAKLLIDGTISEIVGCRCLKGDLFGIELENELDEDCAVSAEDISQVCLLGWKATRDGSLRGSAYEFISKPLPLPELEVSVFSILQQLKKYEWSNSRRTSTHIHINFSDKTLKDLLKFLILYWCVEPILIHTLKPSRIGNTFCISSIHTKEVLLHSLNTTYNLKYLHEFGEEALKYSSMNLYPLAKLGTVECRLFHGTTDAREISWWLKFFQDLLNAQKTFKSQKAIKKAFIDDNPKDFINNIFSPEVANKLLGVVDYPDKLRDGFRSITPLLQTENLFEEAVSFFEKALLEEQELKGRLEKNMLNEENLLDFLQDRQIRKVAPIRYIADLVLDEVQEIVWDAELEDL